MSRRASSSVQHPRFHPVTAYLLSSQDNGCTPTSSKSSSDVA